MKSHLLSDPRLSVISHHDPTITFLAPPPSHLTAKLEHVESHSDQNLLLDDIDNDQSISHGNMMIKRRNKRKQVKQACINCRAAHAGCEDKRPCSRCIRVGKELSCADVPRKKRSCQKRNITVIVNKGFHHTQTTEHSITNVNEMNSSSSQYISMDGGSSFLTNRDILNALQLKDFSQEHLTGSTLIPVYRQVTSNVLSCHMNPARASAFVPLSYNAVPSCISVPSHTSTNTNSNTAASRKDHWGNEDSYYEQRPLYNHNHNHNQNHTSAFQDNDYQDRRFSPGTANRDENAYSSTPSKGLKRKTENIIITQNNTNNTNTNNNNSNRMLYVDHANNYHSVQNEEVSQSASTSSLSNDKEVEKRPRKRARSDPNISYSRRSVTDDILEEREIFHNHNHSEDNNTHFNTTPNTTIKTIVIDEDIDEDSSPRTLSHPSSPLQTSSPIHHNNIENANERKLQPIHTILNEAPSPSRLGSKLNTDKRNINSSSSSDSSPSSHNLLPRIILPPLGGDLYSTGSIILPTSVSGLQGITYYTGPTLQHSHHSQLTMAAPMCLSYNIPI